MWGALEVASAFDADDDDGSRVLAGIIGILGILAGIVVLRHPANSLLAVILILGAWLVVFGIVGLIGAIAHREARAVRLLRSAVDIVLGILVLALPKLSLGTLAVLVGIAFVIRGATAIVMGLRLRHIAATPTEPEPAL